MTPFGLQGLLDLLRLGELELASLFGDGCAFGLRLQLWHQLCDESTGLLWVEVACLFRYIDKGRDDLVVTLLVALDGVTSGAADLDRQLLAVRVADKLARLLLDVPGGAGALVDSLALLGSATVANLLDGLVAFLHGLVESLLLESDLARLFEVFFADFLLGSVELGQVGVVALLDVLVGALQDWVLLQRRNFLVFFNAAKARVRVGLASREVDATLNFAVTPLSTTSAARGLIGQCHTNT